MKAMILAAGRGERMRPLTDHIPKPLLTVGGQPLIVWHLCRLKAAGIDEIVINHAWLGEKIEAALGTGAIYGVDIVYSPEGEKGLETAGGIANALDLLGTEPFLVINGDVLTDIDFLSAKQKAANLNKDWAYLWLVNNPPHNSQGDFAWHQNGRLSSNTDTGVAATFSGVGLYRPELFYEITKGKPSKLAPLLRKAMDLGRVGGEIHQGVWLDVGTPERLAEADKIVMNDNIMVK